MKGYEFIMRVMLPNFPNAPDTELASKSTVIAARITRLRTFRMVYDYSPWHPTGHRGKADSCRPGDRKRNLFSSRGFCAEMQVAQKVWL
jgi:hypothetical protein